MSETHNLKKLQYDGKEIVAEVANRDTSGKIIKDTYVDKNTDQTIAGRKRFDTTPQILDHYEITSKNLFRKNFNIFDNTGGTGTTYAYFKLPDDGKNYTLSVRLKDSTKSFGSNNVFGWTGNGGNFDGSGGWLAMGDTIRLEKHVFYANDNARFISLYSGNQTTFNKLLDRYYIQLEEGTTMTEYVDPDSGIENIYVDVAKVNEIPTKTSELTNDSGYITNAYHDSTKANQSEVNAIQAKIPSAASSSNQLADKAFVNSSIETATATFRGTYTTLEALQAATGDLNDYAFYNHTDAAGNTVFDRYKYISTTPHWVYEYTLNNSSFTAAQWAAINSGVTAGTWVDMSTAQTISGQKDFNTVPRVKVTHETHNLPDAYQEVEYIESSGTQYIDSNYIPNANTKIIFDSIMGVNGISGDIRQGRHGDGQRLSVAIVSSKLEFAIGGYQSINLNVAGQRHLFELDVLNYQGKLDGVVQTTFSSITWTNQQTLYFFGRHMSSGVDGLGNTRNYNIKIYEQNQLIREYVPCYRIADDVIGMYDIVNNVFYTNAGTGTFIKGQNIAPITYESLLTDANFAPVAFSGSYNDLIGTPTIPTVNNGTLTIQKNGTTITTFTANQSTSNTANITVPTKTSDLTNDSGFITSGDIPIKTISVNNTQVQPVLGNVDIDLTSYATKTELLEPQYSRGEIIAESNTTNLYVPAAGYTSFTQNLTGRVNISYDNLNAGEFSDDSTYSSNNPKYPPVGVQRSDYWNSASGTPLNIYIKFATACKPHNLVLKTSSGYTISSCTLTLIQADGTEISQSLAISAGTKQSFEINPDFIEVVGAKINFIPVTWIGLLLIEFSTTQNGFVWYTPETASFTEDLFNRNGSYVRGETNSMIVKSGSAAIDNPSYLLGFAGTNRGNIMLVNPQTFVNNILQNITGYDATKTQTLKNINGTFTWVDD